MILVAIGSNQNGPWGTPRETVERAIAELHKPPLKRIKSSTPIETLPFGLKNQPNFINAVVQIETDFDEPEPLMQHLHDIELSADRRRRIRWGQRTLDLDLLDFNGLIRKGEGPSLGHQRPLYLPHPGIPERAFVLEPIREIAPGWRHPVNGKTAQEMLDELPAE